MEFASNDLIWVLGACPPEQIGKWHTGVDSGYGRDWDYQVVWNRPAHPENAGKYYYDQTLTTNGKDATVAAYSTDNYSQLAADFIHGKNRNVDQPWFLWICYGAIHGPTTPAKRHLKTLQGNDATVPKDIQGPWPEKPAYLNATSAWKSCERSTQNSSIDCPRREPNAIQLRF